MMIKRRIYQANSKMKPLQGLQLMLWEFILNVDKKIIKKVKGSAKGSQNKMQTVQITKNVYYKMKRSMEIQIASEQVK